MRRKRQSGVLNPERPPCQIPPISPKKPPSPCRSRRARPISGARAASQRNSPTAMAAIRAHRSRRWLSPPPKAKPRFCAAASTPKTRPIAMEPIRRCNLWGWRSAAISFQSVTRPNSRFFLRICLRGRAENRRFRGIAPQISC